MKPETNDEFDFSEWFGDLDMSTSVPLTEDEWNDYAYFPREDRVTEKDYLIGYYDMGVFDEKIVRACNEEFAIDSFLCDYQPKRGLPPYIARCETVTRAEIRREVGYTDPPEDRQFERYGNFSNKYYEALHN
ncbi:hypothetical protein ACO0LB_11050 [Undibacterium sp. SXout7W]|uniref:hypothetical protein n=1 Tax=Undibacterium sp. SXout7W TaxID=3413049 RepID=UPI003BF3927A